MPRKKPDLKVVEPQSLTAYLAKHIEVDMIDALDAGFSSEAIQQAETDGSIIITDDGMLKLKMVDYIHPMKGRGPVERIEEEPTNLERSLRRSRSIAKQDGEPGSPPIPPIPDWLRKAGDADGILRRVEMAWATNEGFRKRAGGFANLTSPILDSSGRLVEWPTEQYINYFLSLARRYADPDEKALAVKCICPHILALGNGKAGDAVVFCPDCKHFLRFGFDGVPARCEKDSVK